MHSCTWLFQHRRHQRNSTVIAKSLEHFLKISVPYRNKTFAAKTYINIKNPFVLNKKVYFFSFSKKNTHCMKSKLSWWFFFLLNFRLRYIYNSPFPPKINKYQQLYFSKNIRIQKAISNKRFIGVSGE